MITINTDRAPSRLSPQRAESAARVAARLASRKSGVPADSAWAGVEPLIAELPGVGPRVLQRARRAFTETYLQERLREHYRPGAEWARQWGVGGRAA